MCVLLILFCSLHFTSVVSIIGGHDINIEDAPYHVNYGDVCGGVLINKKWVLTTAHCGTGHDYIRVGSKYRLRGPKIKVIDHILHPKYGFDHEFDYDVQLLELNRGLAFGKTVAPIQIGRKCGEHIFVTGWGYSYEKGDYTDVLQRVKIKLVAFSQCQRVKRSWYNHTLTPRMFCAGDEERDACQGDSGGAAVSSGHLIGLSSFGYGCGRNIPGVYINVSSSDIIEWVRKYIV